MFILREYLPNSSYNLNRVKTKSSASPFSKESEFYFFVYHLFINDINDEDLTVTSVKESKFSLFIYQLLEIS